MLARDITRVSLLAAVWLGALSVARAERELDLSWPAVASCPDRAWLEQRIEAQLGRALGEADVAIEVVASIAPNATGFTLWLRTHSDRERGERTLEAASCRELTEAAALVIALSLDATRAPEPAVSTPPPRDPPATAPRPPRFVLRAGGLAEFGFLPRVGAGAELAIALLYGAARVEIAGLWLPPVRSARADPEGRVEVTLGAARAAYCHDLVSRRARLAGCAGVELGRATGTGLELVGPNSKHFVWSAGWAALRLGLPLHRRVGVVLEPALAMPFLRRRFVSEDAQGDRVAALHEPAAYSLRATLGLELLF